MVGVIPLRPASSIGPDTLQQFLPFLCGAGVWVLGLPLGLWGQQVWLLLVLQLHLGLWGRFQLQWLVVVGPPLGLGSLSWSGSLLWDHSWCGPFSLGRFGLCLVFACSRPWK